MVHRQKRYVMVDIPGTYSLLASSMEEEVARDFICFGHRVRRWSGGFHVFGSPTSTSFAGDGSDAPRRAVRQFDGQTRKKHIQIELDALRIS